MTDLDDELSGWIRELAPHPLDAEPRLRRLAELVATWGARFNLTAHGDPAQVLRHLGLDGAAPLDRDHRAVDHHLFVRAEANHQRHCRTSLAVKRGQISIEARLVIEAYSAIIHYSKQAMLSKLSQHINFRLRDLCTKRLDRAMGGGLIRALLVPMGLEQAGDDRAVHIDQGIDVAALMQDLPGMLLHPNG